MPCLGLSNRALQLYITSALMQPLVWSCGVHQASLLSNEVLAKSALTWPIVNSSRSRDAGGPTIVLSAQSSQEVDWGSSRSEGYTVEASASGVTVTGVDERGLLYGVGRLIRLMNLTLVQNYYTPRYSSATLALPTHVASHPDRYMRGVQMGYRPKTNSYDGLTPELFEQYVIDLSLFGVNQIELIPHSFDDAPFSPHYQLSHDDMNVRMSSILAKYGMNVSLWYPACDPAGDVNLSCQTGDYHNSTVMAAAKADWHQTYSSMPRIDTVFINAGDPGGQNPDDLMMIAQASFAILKTYHPNAELWLCPQDWTVPDYTHWAKLASTTEAQEWLSGIIYGPGMPIPLDVFQKSTAPAVYPVRLYPDITHSLGDQVPVPNWDPIFHITENRETVNPRPVQESTMAASNKPYGDAGMGTYNEGCHDDVNKHVWAAVMWGCDDTSTAITMGNATVRGSGTASCETDTLVRQWLTDYAHVHFGQEVGDLATAGIYGLENNWVGPILTNPSINATFAIFQQITKVMPVRLRWKWRLQQLFYRANYDKFLQIRATISAAGEAHALATLLAQGANPTQAMATAEGILDACDVAVEAASQDYFVEMRVWAEALFQSVHQQFSVPLYGGEFTRRGANLDLAKMPLSNAPFLRTSFAAIRALPSAAEKGAKIKELATWQDAGPGGFYDNLGQVGAEPHYVHSGPHGTHPQTGDQSLFPYSKSHIIYNIAPRFQRGSNVVPGNLDLRCAFHVSNPV